MSVCLVKMFSMKHRASDSEQKEAEEPSKLTT
jgi:hypothetical protein